jgi:adenylate cyclase
MHGWLAATGPSTSRRPEQTRQAGLAALVVVAPAVAFAWLLLDARRNQLFAFPIEHFLIVTVVSLLALGVALLVALQMEQYSVVLIALGFMSMGGLFSVHALSTPGVPLHGMGGGPSIPASEIGIIGESYLSGGSGFNYGGTIVGLSAFLSLFVPACLFAAASTTAATDALRRLPAHSAVLAILVLVAVYAALSGWRTDLLVALPLTRPPWSNAFAGLTMLLLGYAAWQQGRLYLRNRFPTHGALVLAYVLLAQAQLLMAAAAFWSLAWWEYHVVMLAATVLALGALFVELRRRRALERFLPPPVVDRVVAGDLRRLIAGERRVVTILFADLRGSTALAEHLEPEAVVALLNDYVGALARCVLARGGMVRQFLGDGLMAIFGAFELDASDGANPAVEAALRMRQAIAEVNAIRSNATMRFGVGIHTGEVVLGSIGIPQQAEITAFGDTVNTASRLQDLSKQFGVDSVLSAETATRLAGERTLCSLGTVEVRGRQQPVDVYTLAE